MLNCLGVHNILLSGENCKFTQFDGHTHIKSH